ncbi:hypothetical protein KFK09_026379 [Dendrobium nobile]|uniref:CCHC-type domain-containing protein n=1 Tax=Dendrobium nobile TaxID=94219 RepID=A0A8T3A7Z9_DENNO|nr:hypothetical protein KFK09_026379 [Dendrobium nobile]
MEDDDRRHIAGDSPIKASGNSGNGLGITTFAKRHCALVTLKNMKSALNSSGISASSSGMKIFVNRFANSNAIPGLCRSVINENSQPLVNEDVHSNLNKADISNAVNVSDDFPKSAISNGPWSRKPYINLDFKVDDLILSDDGKAVKMYSKLEVANANKLSKSLVIKVFGKETPPHMIAWELRKQWKQFDQFHFTILGGGWFLCSFSSKEMVKAMLLGGPWFVNDHIIGMEKWTPEFNSSLTKGLSSPIWVRLPNLPLQCWDEKNVACIASRVGIPLMIDGNMFNWGRREFAKICVRIQFDQPLPLEVWVDSLGGRFFQKVEYEKVSNLCFACGKIGHVDKNCLKPKDLLKEVEVEGDYAIAGKLLEHSTFEVSTYGPWILVNNRKKRFFKQNNKWINPNYVKPMKKAATEVAVKNKSLSDFPKEVSQAVTEAIKSSNIQIEEGEICSSGFNQENNSIGKVACGLRSVIQDQADLSNVKNMKDGSGNSDPGFCLNNISCRNQFSMLIADQEETEDVIPEGNPTADSGNLICSVIYYCWNSRNQLVHGGCDDSCYVIAYRAVIQSISSFKKGLIRENWDANQLFKLSKSSWLPPPPGWIKVNVDASIFLNNSTGIGGIFRDCKGRGLAAFGFHTIHWDIVQMELLAILSLRDHIKDWMLEAKGIVIEGDNLNVINIFQNALNKNKWIHEEFLNPKD